MASPKTPKDVTKRVAAQVPNSAVRGKKKETFEEWRTRDDARRKKRSIEQKAARLKRAKEIAESKGQPSTPKSKRKPLLARLTQTVINPEMICPLCHSKGTVRPRSVRKTSGISGSKVAAAFLTGGLSLFATGLSQKEWRREATCDNCGESWSY